jgi:hypothetical protein
VITALVIAGIVCGVIAVIGLIWALIENRRPGP